MTITAMVPPIFNTRVLDNYDILDLVFPLLAHNLMIIQQEVNRKLAVVWTDFGIKVIVIFLAPKTRTKQIFDPSKAQS